jgi:uncharacterized membrane protein YdjX (TVP38/TMEM64 family)
MEILYIVFCILRPICLPIPESLIILWGGQIMNRNIAFLVGLLSSLIGIAGMYLISSRASMYIIHKFNIQKNITTFQEMIEFYNIKIIGILFIIPVFPDSIICIGASLLKLNLPLFLLIAIISKIISIGMIEYSGLIGEVFQVNKWQIIIIELFVINIISYMFKLHKRIKEKVR